MAKYIGRHLMIKGEYVEPILRGEKKATIRLGIIKPRYKEVMLHGGGRPVAIVKIEDVIYKRISDLTDEDARLDGFSSRGELIEALRKSYGKLDPQDKVTIIRFEVLKKISPSELRKLPPLEVARLAVRYVWDKLSEDDRKILEEVLRTKSVRKAAVNLYGSVDSRFKIRKSINRAYRELKKEGIL